MKLYYIIIIVIIIYSFFSFGLLINARGLMRVIRNSLFGLKGIHGKLFRHFG